ncbi:glycosyltransferase [Enterococcus viikkiensis]|uniref:Glycosyltransferase n=1 Tax=Enterococcus viikkiensis TaxID=930854 RepID=A0ABU3FNK8_9ENTE|nr:glycosyltransferase [Enterococcus viikkiensis]MDT2827552.1 glycosyltransferase [Enterococcus viikkiensis]
MFKMVVVLYNMTFSESSTIISLNKLLASAAFPEIREVLIFDNSQKANEPQGLDQRFAYYHSKENVGLARAYNRALEESKEEIAWLVTLDQDTTLTGDYLNELISCSAKVSDSTVAIAPIIKDQDQQISPVRSDTLRPLHSALPQGNQTYSSVIMVINSATAVRTGFLKKIGGYNLEFPLDYLDHWLSWRIFAEGKEVIILKVELQHELSVLNYAEHMNFFRYQTILQAEKCYYSLYATNLFFKYRQQLFLRGAKQLVTGKFRYAKRTFIFLFLGGKDGKQSTKENG